MSTKTISTISSVITVVLLLLLGVLYGFIQLVMLNGYSEREGGPALIAFGICQVAGLILCAVLSGRLAAYFVAKMNWGKFMASAVSVLAGTVLGGLLGIPSFFISVIVAESLR